MKDIEKTADYEILSQAADYLKTNPKVQYNRYPEYDSRVIQALGTLSDTDYLENHEKLIDTEIETMSLEQIATMYTFILRGERFCDGHIAAYIEDGSIYRLVKRHLQLLEEQNGNYTNSMDGDVL